MKPATPSQKRADCQAINPNKEYKQLFHWAKRANSSSISPRKARRSGTSTRADTRTTMSRCRSLLRDRRKDSRTMRLTRLRFTAERTCFFAMTTPIRAVAIELGRCISSKCLPRRILRKAKTDENSSVLRNRCSLRKPNSTPAADTSNAEAYASLGAACADNGTAAARTHANEKPMGTFAPDYGGLICAFHDCRLPTVWYMQKEKREITSFQRYLVKSYFFFGLWITLWE